MAHQPLAWRQKAAASASEGRVAIEGSEGRRVSKKRCRPGDARGEQQRSMLRSDAGIEHPETAVSPKTLAASNKKGAVA